MLYFWPIKCRAETLYPRVSRNPTRWSRGTKTLGTRLDGLLTESAYSSTFHKAIEFSLKKLGKPKLELRREQYDAIRAICFERKDALAVLPTGFRKSLIYREFLTTFEAAVSQNVIILLCLLCHPEAGL